MLILLHLDINLDYYDLGIGHRDCIDDWITIDTVHAIKKHGMDFEYVMTTSGENRVQEFNLKKIWISPNKTIRNKIGRAHV